MAWINWLIFLVFVGFVLYIFTTLYLDHRKRRERARRAEKFNAWCKKNPMEVVAPYMHKILKDPHGDYRGPWEND